MAATRGKTITYGVNSQADVTARSMRIEPNRLEFIACLPDGEMPITLNIGGVFQVYNAISSIAACIGMDISKAAITEGLASLKVATVASLSA